MEERTNIETEQSELARAMLILSNYDWLKTKAAQAGVEIIPIKGIDLLQTVYSRHLDRHLKDIDILCRSEADCLKLVAHLCDEGYRVEFPFAVRPEALASKHKISLLSCSPLRVNIDVHTAFITKKFFAQTTGTFNADALDRCREGRMADYDRWLFLAQHAAFHRFTDYKWIKDIRIIYDGYTPERQAELMDTAVFYGFKRVAIAALYHMYKEEPEALKETFARLSLSSADKRFLAFICHCDRPFSRNLPDRTASSYWEFAFIHSTSNRLRALLSLLFPSKGLLTNIYRVRSARALLFFYPLNFVVAGLAYCLFCLLYAAACLLGRDRAKRVL